MIYLTKKTGEKTRFVLNHRLIEQVNEQEGEKGSLITLRDGKRIIVEETMSQIVQRVQSYEVEVMNLQHVKKEEGTNEKTS